MRITAVSILLFLCLLGQSVGGKPPATTAPLSPTPRAPGVDLAEGLTQLTGIAISPLLGMSAIGSWYYFDSSPAQRAGLPWFFQPYTWITGFAILALCFLKDVVGTAVPALLKKPFDFLELFENKLSALLASTTFLPLIVSEMTRLAPAVGAPATAPSLSGASLFSFEPAALWLIATPLALVGFFVVWLFGHVINVLIALSPFVVVDAALKLSRASLLAFVVIATFISPYLGALVCICLIVLAWILAPWAFRLTVFGTLSGLDVLLPWRAARHMNPTAPHAFLARAVSRVPVRTYGRLSAVNDGAVTFTYRPWLVLPQRCVTTPPGRVSLTEGLLFPSLRYGAHGENRSADLITFLPRYRSYERLIGSHFGVSDIEENFVSRGFRRAVNWIYTTLSIRRIVPNVQCPPAP